MKSEIWWLVAGIVIGAGLTFYVSDRAYRDLKVHADSVSIASNSTVRAAHRVSDSLKARNAILEAQKQKVIVRAVKDTTDAARADSLLAVAWTTEDSIIALTEEVTALKSTVKDLWEALAIANSQIEIEKHRGDSLLAKTDTLNSNVQDLTQKINKLKGTPKWLKIGTEVVKDVGLVYAGTRLVRRN